MDLIDSVEQWNKLAFGLRHAAFEHCSEALMLIDPLRNTYVDCNIAAARLLGYQRREILDLPISKIHGRELAQLVVTTDEALSLGQARSRAITCRQKSGEHIAVELNAARVCFNRTDYMIIALRDIRSEEVKQRKDAANQIVKEGLLEWKHLESIFQRGERENLLMLTSVGDGIYCVDVNGLCTFINPAAKRLLGRTDDDVLGQNIHYIHHHTREDGRHYPVEECPIYAAIRDGVVHEGVQEMFWKHDGSPFPVEFTSTPIISDSAIVGAVVVFRDISERLETERKLRAALEEVSQLKQRLEDENEYLQQEIAIEKNYHGIIGESSSITRILQQIDLVAQTRVGVLITGESGTGKERIARAIHEASDRKDKPLIRVNCAAIPHELFESEFFGHSRGAFTGALKDRIGRFELADGGTLFLDEVGEIPLTLQSKLLRVLQEGQFERVGEGLTRSVDVRVIAATNRDLKAEAAANRFREDLYFRLNVFPLNAPPLRERVEDIPLLAVHFIEQASKRNNSSLIKLRQSDVQRLQGYSWPGNIRELQNVIERAVITAKNGRVNLDLPSDGPSAYATTVRDTPPLGVLSDEEMQAQVVANMLAALEQCGWKLFGEDGAAALLGLKPTTLASRIKRLGLRPVRAHALRPEGGN